MCPYIYIYISFSLSLSLSLSLFIFIFIFLDLLVDFSTLPEKQTGSISPLGKHPEIAKKRQRPGFQRRARNKGSISPLNRRPEKAKTRQKYLVKKRRGCKSRGVGEEGPPSLVHVRFMGLCSPRGLGENAVRKASWTAGYSSID